MLFCDGARKKFPYIKVDEKQVKNTRERELERGEEVNASKFRSESTYQNWDYVVLRNTKKTSRIDPYFEPDPCQVIDVSRDGRASRRASSRRGINQLPSKSKIKCPASGLMVYR